MNLRETSAVRLVVLLALSLFSGCGWWSAQTENGGDDDVADVPDEVPPGGLPALSPLPAAQTPAVFPGSPAAERVTLVKTISQVLRQPAPQGSIESRSTLELLLSITIEANSPADRPRRELDPQTGPKRVQVVYRQVRFRQDVPGQAPVEYDSAAPGASLPAAALGYHGFKENSLEFRLTADNQVLEVIGFDQFAGRCLKNVPAEHREQLASSLAPDSPGDAVATYVDETIGILPAGAREGDLWVRDRQIRRPVRLATNTHYALRRLTPGAAEVDIQGTISAGAVPAVQVRRDFDIAVRGGNIAGSCVIDRRTGMPLQARIEQTLEMHVRLGDGGEFDQHKSTLTTIWTVPEQTVLAGGSSDSAQPATIPPRIPQAGFEARNAAR